MTNFQERIKKAKEAENYFEYWLKFMGIEYSKNGYEHHKQSNQYMAKLRVRNDVEALNIRFTPDFLVISDSITYFEVKWFNGTVINIEKKSYDRLLRLDADVKIVAYNNMNLYMLNDLNQVKFHANYFDHKNHIVDDHNWIYPRSKNFDYDQYQKQTSGSGTAFSRIKISDNNFIHLNQLNLFKN